MITIIAGIAQNNIIGNKGELPWHIPEDLKRFKELTLNKPVIMGRKTYESIVKKLGKPLPQRVNIVVTSQEDYPVSEGVVTAKNIYEAIESAKNYGDSIYIIGGQNVYEQTLKLADKLEITQINKEYEGDSFFPKISNEWKKVKSEQKEGFSFDTYQRNKGTFIAFEGIDGCGKSTQIRKLTQYIFEKNKYNHVILTRNPYKDTSIRKTILENDDPHTQADKLADLFIKDRFLHAEEIVKPNIQKGHFVLTDRYKFSTICYQSAQGLAMDDLIKKQEGLPVPDMTFIMDVSPEVARERIRKDDASIRGKEHKFEAHLDFTTKLRENYLKAAEIMKSKGEKIFIINAERSPEEIFEDIKSIFDDQ